MEILTNAQAVTSAKANINSQTMANAKYNNSLMASRALQNSSNNSEVSIASLEKGDVFKGEITNINGQSVTVSLGSGQTLTALMLEQVAINIGNHLYFEVKENDGETVTIRPLTGEKFSPRNQTIEKALQSAGLQLNEKNMAVVKELMDASMPIDRNSIMKILQQLLNHKGADIKTIVSMTKCNLPITTENIVQFEQYMLKNHQLNSQMDGITDTIQNMYQNLAGEDMFAGDVLRFNQQILNIFAASDNAETSIVLSNVFGMSESEIAPFLDLNMAFEMDEEGQFVMDRLGNRYPQGSIQMDAYGQLMLNESGTQFVLKEEFMAQMSDAQKEAFSKGEFYSEITDAQPEFTNGIQSRFSEMLQELGVPKETLATALHPNQSATELMNFMQEFIANSMNLSDEAIKQFFASKEYAFLLNSVIDAQWKLTPEQVKDKDKVIQLFQRIDQQSKQLADLGSQFSDSGQQLSNQAQNMNDNLQFMQMLNERYTYAQLPLQLASQDTNGELYVYTNKKSLEQNQKDISVLLHLDMDHLGSTDVHVQLIDHKVVARFYMDDQRSMNTVKSHIDQLSNQIAALGLSLETEVVRRTDKKEQVENFVEDFLAKDLPASQVVKRYNFDMRA